MDTEIMLKIVSLSKGNPGALTAMCRLYDIFPEGIDMIQNSSLRGSEIYLLWNDVCNRDDQRFAEEVKKL